MIVVRCAACGGPLESEAPRITCRYCGCVNVVRHQPGEHGPILQAAEEARALAATVGDRIERVQEEFARTFEAFRAGEPGLEPRMLELQEGILRLTYAPTLHFMAAFDPEDPQIASGYAQIDKVVRDVLQNWQETFDKVRPNPTD